MAFSILGSIKKKDMGVLVKLQRSSKPEKKWMVTFVRESGRKKTIHFGQAGASDFPSNKDVQRRERYLERHRDREDWGASGVETSGWWARWLLWNRKSIAASLTDIRKIRLPLGYKLLR